MGIAGRYFYCYLLFPAFVSGTGIRAEIVKPLFVVLAVSLGLSWILALCQTTTFGNFILKEAVPAVR